MVVKYMSAAVRIRAVPAVSTAIHDAVGVWVCEWPFTPERILKALGKI